MAKKHPPYTLAMVVCDAIWRDPSTGKYTLLGLFSSVAGRRFPTVHPMMAVYVAVTDGRGRAPLQVRLIDANEEREPLFSATGEVDFSDPRQVIEMDFHMGPIEFPEPGEYRLQLTSDQELLMERRIFLVRQRGEGEKAKER